jgi:hypothetical protein
LEPSEHIVHLYIFVLRPLINAKNEKSTNQGLRYIMMNYKIFFFAGAETGQNRFNIFTGSFIRLMTKIFHDDFVLINGINFRLPMMNVFWALNNAQKPVPYPENQKITNGALRQITGTLLSHDTQIIIISSSSGSVMAAQTACWLSEKNRKFEYFTKPFHLVLGASMISPESELYRKLRDFQTAGLIGTILHDEVQDEGDSSVGVGGLSRSEAYRNAFGLMFPFLSRKFKRPSFLNTNPESGHLHRKRSRTVQKAIDYVRIILIDHNLAGEFYKEKAITAIKDDFYLPQRTAEEKC